MVTSLETGDVLILIGNPRLASRTRALADATAQALLAHLGAAAGEPTVLELAEIVGVSFGPEPASAARPVVDPFGQVSSARLLIVASPTYKGSYTGLLKIFLDEFPPNALADVVAVPVAIAAAEPHREAIGAALRDVLVALGARVPAEPFAVLEAQLTSPAHLAAEWVNAHGDTLRAELAHQVTV